MRDIENQNCLHKNRLPARSTVIPADRQGIYYANKEQSPNIVMLNGEYDFTYEGIPSGKLPVPSMWQYHGFGVPRYTNTEYPFPLMPPYTGNYNPVGEYERRFVMDQLPECCILHFDGVDNAFYVYINEAFAGFSKGSHLPSEFDISKLIKLGENKIHVVVYTYSDASYLECQDMIWANGIFRDVYLICTDRTHIWDYRIMTDLQSMRIKTILAGEEFHGVSLRVKAAGQEQVQENVCREQEFFFEIVNPIPWNAEEPYLYDVTIELLKNGEVYEVHSKKVGLRTTEINREEGIYLLNEKPIRFKGINRHEYHPEKGRIVTYEQTRQELQFLKDHNFNAVRCSHYPNVPYFYELCNEIGLYVIDESDIESHGMWETGDAGRLLKDPEWLSALMDRTERMYERDKNETCVVIWSLGNESGTGPNMKACAEYFRKAEVTHPVIYTSDNAKMPEYTDFCQAGYMPLWVMGEIDYYQQFSNSQKKGCPVMFTEYAHMMGNSPGLLADYWKFVLEHNNFAGGFIWEFKNHGICRNGTYLYGGDFGEANHSYNFNMDGMLLADSTPKPSVYEAAEVFAPLWIRYDNGIVVLNTNDFRNSKYLKVCWELQEDYQVIKSGELTLDIEPRKLGRIELPEFESRAECKYYFNIKSYEGEHKAGNTQIELPAITRKKPESAAAVDFIYDDAKDEITAGNSRVRFTNGMISHYEVNGIVLIHSVSKINLYRKPTDNDGIKGKHDKITDMWNNAFIRDYAFHPVKKKTEQTDTEFILTYTGRICPEGRYAGFDAVVRYRIRKNGVVLTEIHGEPYGRIPGKLPRIGLVFELSKQWDKVTWFGRGPHENYHDRKHSAAMGLYQKSVKDMSFHYDRPQENGNRCDNRFVCLTDDFCGLTVFGCDTFDFSIHDYTMDALLRAEHKGELIKADKNYLYIDYLTRGLGNASCGHDPEIQHELAPHSFRFVYGIAPFAGTEAAMELCRTDYGVRTEKLSDKFVYQSGEYVRQNFDSVD